MSCFLMRAAASIGLTPISAYINYIKHIIKPIFDGRMAIPCAAGQDRPRNTSQETHHRITAHQNRKSAVGVSDREQMVGSCYIY
ncbi:hypothetical protein T492DRAFT_952117 [Pavlovales sp. CCMP2436]|nr:hypothetical protein T492DRAFT_952117 [Pavlovales sp. CCMP2436]